MLDTLGMAGGLLVVTFTGFFAFCQLPFYQPLTKKGRD